MSYEMRWTSRSDRWAFWHCNRVCDMAHCADSAVRNPWAVVESEHSRMAWSRLAKTDPQARYMREATEIGRKSPGALKKSAFARLGINEVTAVTREGCQIAPAAIPRKTSARESQSVHEWQG